MTVPTLADVASSQPSRPSPWSWRAWTTSRTIRWSPSCCPRSTRSPWSSVRSSDGAPGVLKCLDESRPGTAERFLHGIGLSLEKMTEDHG